jgi:hypothetical protein
MRTDRTITARAPSEQEGLRHGRDAIAPAFRMLLPQAAVCSVRDVAAQLWRHRAHHRLPLVGAERASIRGCGGPGRVGKPVPRIWVVGVSQGAKRIRAVALVASASDTFVTSVWVTAVKHASSPSNSAVCTLDVLK